jgi:hypothetical protein
MNRFLFTLCVAGVTALSIGCNPFAPDQSVVLGVTKLDAPATVSPGSPLNVVLTVTTGGCKTFDHIEVERTASSASLTVWGRDGAKGAKNVACPAYIVDTPHSYQLNPPFQSPFTIQVDRGRVSPLTATVQVQ